MKKQQSVGGTAKADAMKSNTFTSKQSIAIVIGVSAVVAMSLAVVNAQQDDADITRSEQPESSISSELNIEGSAGEHSTEAVNPTTDSSDSNVRAKAGVSGQATISASGDVKPNVRVNGQSIDVPANGTVNVPVETVPTQTESNESTSNSSFSINIQTTGEAEVDDDVSSEVEINTENDIRIRNRNR